MEQLLASLGHTCISPHHDFDIQVPLQPVPAKSENSHEFASGYTGHSA